MTETKKVLEEAVRKLQEQLIKALSSTDLNREKVSYTGQRLIGLSEATGYKIQDSETLSMLFQRRDPFLAIRVCEGELQEELMEKLATMCFSGETHYVPNSIIQRFIQNKLSLPETYIQTVYQAFCNLRISPTNILEFHKLVGVPAEKEIVENYIYKNILAKTQADECKFLVIDPFPSCSRVKSNQLRIAFDISDLVLPESVVVDNAKKVQVASTMFDFNERGYAVRMLFSSMPQDNTGAVDQLFKDYFASGFDLFEYAGKEGHRGFDMANVLRFEGMLPTNQAVQQAYASKLKSVNSAEIFEIGRISGVAMNEQNMATFGEYVRESPEWKDFR